MHQPDAIVAIVDDDSSVREGLGSLLRSAGWKVETFASAEEFLARRFVVEPSCVVLDLQLPELSGLDLQTRMAQINVEIPIVFITGHGSIPDSVQAIKAGAIEFLTKPFDEQQLFKAVTEAMERDREARKHRTEFQHLKERYESLTPREQEVLRQVVSGLLNKQIAVELEIAEITVKVHRGRVMQKMHAGSVADLVRMAEKLGIHSPENS